MLISIQGTESQKFNGVIKFLCLYDATFRGKFQPLLKNMKKWTVSYSIVEIYRKHSCSRTIFTYVIVDIIVHVFDIFCSKNWLQIQNFGLISPDVKIRSASPIIFLLWHRWNNSSFLWLSIYKLLFFVYYYWFGTYWIKNVFVWKTNP